MAEERVEVDETQVGLVRDELRRATDIGEERSRQQLQEACGIGAGDLDKVLTHLRTDGEVSEVVPDGWRLIEEHDGEERDDEGAGDVDEPDVSLDEAEQRAAAGKPPIPGAPRRRQAQSVDVRVELPFGVAKTLDEDALGGIVKAGIGEADEHQARFVFIVEP